MAEFVTPAEREAFQEFVEADRANFEFDVETRLATAWAAAREFWQELTPEGNVPLEKQAPLTPEMIRGGWALELGRFRFTQAQAAAIEEYVQGRIGAFQAKDRDDEPAKEAVLSEFGRGYEEGKGEYRDRELRLHAVQIAAQGLAPGHSSDTLVTRAKEILAFLSGASVQ